MGEDFGPDFKRRRTDQTGYISESFRTAEPGASFSRRADRDSSGLPVDGQELGTDGRGRGAKEIPRAKQMPRSVAELSSSIRPIPSRYLRRSTAIHSSADGSRSSMKGKRRQHWFSFSHVRISFLRPRAKENPPDGRSLFRPAAHQLRGGHAEDLRWENLPAGTYTMASASLETPFAIFRNAATDESFRPSSRLVGQLQL